jgi:hypothetical protein
VFPAFYVLKVQFFGSADIPDFSTAIIYPGRHSGALRDRSLETDRLLALFSVDNTA